MACIRPETENVIRSEFPEAFSQTTTTFNLQRLESILDKSAILSIESCLGPFSQ
jgi:hypothetical protein